MRWLITGGSGFIGKYLLNALREDRDERQAFIVYDIKECPNSINNDNNIIWVKGDVLDKDGIEKVIKKYNVKGIIHLAYVLLSESDASPYNSIKINSMGTLNILDLLLKYNIKKTIWSSSVQVYGPAVYYGEKKWIDESYDVKPVSLYGVCKAFCEDIFSYYRSQYNLNIVGLRFSGVFGYGRTSGSNTYLCDLIKDIVQGKNAIMPYANHINNLIYVKDAVRVIKKCIEVDSFYKSPIYNICSNIVYSNKGIADILKSIFPDTKIEIQSGQFGLRATPYTSPALAKEELGFIPSYSLKEAIQDFVLKCNKNDIF